MTASRRRRMAPGGLPRAKPRMRRAKLTALYEEHFTPLVRYVVCQHRLPKADACDVVQQAFFIALTKMGPDGNAKAWLVRVIDRLAIRHHRTAARRSELLARWSQQDEREEPETQEEI